MTDPIVLGNPSPSTAADPSGNDGLAAVLQAGLEQLEADSVHTFPVPGWTTMRLRARKPSERDRETATTPAKTIAVATEAILLDQDGEWNEVRGGWRGVAELMGRSDWSTTQVIQKVLDNGLRLEEFSAEITAWLAGRRQQIEHLLGE